MTEPDVVVILIDPDLTIVDAETAVDVEVSLLGTPGPAGATGAKGDDGERGPKGDPGVGVTAIAPLHYDEVEAVLSIDPQKFTFNQVAPSATWSITHNLGTKPAVTIVDSANQQVYGDITYDDDNSLQIHFSSAFSGAAYLS